MHNRWRVRRYTRRMHRTMRHNFSICLRNWTWESRGLRLSTHITGKIAPKSLQPNERP